jgi:hypothetical protein
MLSLSASHAETEAHVVRTTVVTIVVHVVMTTAAHVVTTEAQEVHVATVSQTLR